MENLKALEEEGKQDEEAQKAEEAKPMPFGMVGIHFLCNVTQYAAFLGLTALLLMLIRIYGPK